MKEDAPTQHPTQELGDKDRKIKELETEVSKKDERILELEGEISKKEDGIENLESGTNEIKIEISKLYLDVEVEHLLRRENKSLWDRI